MGAAEALQTLLAFFGSLPTFLRSDKAIGLSEAVDVLFGFVQLSERATAKWFFPRELWTHGICFTLWALGLTGFSFFLAGSGTCRIFAFCLQVFDFAGILLFPCGLLALQDFYLSLQALGLAGFLLFPCRLWPLQDFASSLRLFSRAESASSPRGLFGLTGFVFFAGTLCSVDSLLPPALPFRHGIACCFLPCAGVRFWRAA